MLQEPSSQPSVCPPSRVLADYRVGRLSADVSDEISTHIAGCRFCRTVLDTLAASANDPLARETKDETRDLLPIDHTTNSFAPKVEAEAGADIHARDLTPPVRHLGQYQLLRVLGTGGMGDVCLGYHQSLKKWVAVKILPREATLKPVTVARFKREMEAIGRLDHPNIVRATDAGEIQGIHFLVMELVDGADLHRLLRITGPFSIADACEIIRQAAIGLQYAHEQSMVHRDIKPSNLILDRFGRVKILDLGLALLGDRSGQGGITRSGQAMGTLNYMAPEQWDSAGRVEITADIYSLGCTLYTLLTGLAPFGGTEFESALRKMAAHAGAPIPRAGTLRPDVPPELDELIARMMAKSPDDRFATPAELAEALEPFARGAQLEKLGRRIPPLNLPECPEPLPIEPSPPGQPTTLFMEGHSKSKNSRTRLILTVMTGLVVLSIAAFLLIRFPITRTPNVTPDKIPKSEPANEKTSTRRSDPERFPPRIRSNALDQEPDRFSWWSQEGNAVFLYQPQKGILNLQTAYTGMLRLGSTNAGRYKIRCSFHQLRWDGGFGIYFGCQPTGNPGEHAFQAINTLANAGPDRRFSLERLQARITLAPNEKPMAATTQVGCEYVSQPQHVEHTMEITVGPRGLENVLWDDEPCPSLCGDAINKLPASRQFLGDFGIFCQGASVTVRIAEFLPLD